MTKTKIKATRESSWELLRILAMLAIILCHFAGQSGFFIWGQPALTEKTRIFSSAGRIAVNIFFLLGAWFMVSAQITGKRILSFYLQVWTYTVLLTLYVFFRGYTVLPQDMLSAFFPFLTKAVWFVSAYIMLLFIAPFLQKILEWKREKLLSLIIILGFIEALIPTIFFFKPMDDGWFAILGWICFIYLATGYYKKYIADSLKINKWIVLSAGLILYSLLLFGWLYFDSFAIQGNRIADLIIRFCMRSLNDYKTLPNLIIATCIFYFFQHLKIGYNRTINFIATGAFAAYILHQTPAVIPVIWRFWFQCNQWIKGDNAFYYALLVPFAVYFVALLLEWLRKKLLEPIIIKSKPFNYIASKIDKLIGN